MFFIRLLIFIVCSICTLAGAAQKTDIKFEHLSMREGLSMNPVTAILQDSKGFMWFGTQDGLNKFDGYSFKIYKTEDNSTDCITDNFITSLALDAQGKVWVGTLGGISIYDYETGNFSQITSANSGLKSDKILHLSVDARKKVWIGTDKGVFIGEKDKVVPAEKYIRQLADLNVQEVLCIYHDSFKNIWFGTTNGLFSFNHKFKILSAIKAGNGASYISNNTVLSVFEDQRKNIWIGTLDGLNKYVPPSEFKTYYFKERQTPDTDTINNKSNKNAYSIINNYTGNTIRCMIQDYSGRIWIGTDMELVIFDPDKESFVSYQKDLINPTGINDHFIRTIYKDNSDIVWIGTLGNGINKTDLKPKKFTHYQKIINDPQSLPENYVRCMAEAGDGKIWVGTLVGGLALFDPVTGKFTHYKNNGKNDGTSPNDNNIWAAVIQNKNTLWVGTNNGLNKLDLSTGRFSYFRHNPEDIGSLSENTIRCIFIDSKNNLWVGTEGGLNLFDSTTQKFIKYTEGRNNPSALSSNTVWKIVEDASGALWIATNNGLNKLEKGATRFIHYKNKKGDINSLSNNGVRTLFIDEKEQLWAGTQNGLNIYQPQKDNFIRLTEKNGLPNSFIYSILQDHSGLIWISTNKGIASLDPEKELKVRTYDIYDGLQDYEFNTNAALITSKGEIYYGGPGGMNRIIPSKIKLSSVNPPVVITMIKIFDRIFVADKDPNEIDVLELNYDENTVYFEFASLDYSNPSRNIYRYRLEGFDRDWIASGNTRSAKYTNLYPGTYTFIIQGTNADGKWSSYEKRIQIVIVPPFWQTMWFYGLSLALVVLLILFIYRWRVSRFKRENAALEEKIVERTRLIHEEKKKIEVINRELEKLSIVASKSDNAVIIADHNFIIEWINEAFIKMHCSLEDYRMYFGKSVVETSNNPEFPNILNRAIQEKKSISYESENHNFEGKKFFVQSTLTPIFSEQGQLRKIVIIDTDITERRKSEEIIRERNKDITDSINYAVRIQQAIFPDKKKINSVLNESFVYFKPKDIVSGDFYFIEEIFSNEDHQLAGFAVGDCTGHGVPGAFMSIIANNFLKQSIHLKEINNPAQALDFVSLNIFQTLSSGAGNQAIRDGMDIGFCVIDFKKFELVYAGANRPLLIFSDQKLTEIKGDTQAVGFQYEVKPFTNIKVKVKPGDMIYLFSDGYADQFGGPHGKKFKYARFKELLSEIHRLPLSEQSEKLNTVFLDWRCWKDESGYKKELEQIDDVCVLGVRITA